MDVTVWRPHGQLSTQHTKPRPAPRHTAAPRPGLVLQLGWSFLASSSQEGKVSPLTVPCHSGASSCDSSEHTCRCLVTVTFESSLTGPEPPFLLHLPMCWAQHWALGSQVGVDDEQNGQGHFSLEHQAWWLPLLPRVLWLRVPRHPGPPRRLPGVTL